MKTTKKILAGLVMLLVSISFSVAPLQTKAQYWVSSQYFYDQLSPYGSWVYSHEYGHVWLPDAGPGFRPYYSNGHWTYTHHGWMWVSHYNWGWAAFHYGSWNFDPYYGWMWIPGYHWAPAWVTWGYYGGYYGWAPIGPGWAYGHHHHHHPINHWVFVHPRHMNDAAGSTNYLASSGGQVVINNTTIINNVENISIVDNSSKYNDQTFYSGPSREAVEKVANGKIEVAEVKESGNPGKDASAGKEVTVYRPSVNTADKATAKPSKVVPIESVKRTETGKAAGAAKTNVNTENRGVNSQKTGSGKYDTKPDSKGGTHPANYNRNDGAQQKTSPGKDSRYNNSGQKPAAGKGTVREAPAQKSNPGTKTPAGKGAQTPVKKTGNKSTPETKGGR